MDMGLDFFCVRPSPQCPHTTYRTSKAQLPRKLKEAQQKNLLVQADPSHQAIWVDSAPARYPSTAMSWRESQQEEVGLRGRVLWWRWAGGGGGAAMVSFGGKQNNNIKKREKE
ncbi:hypothetical protein FH972_014476 [Carpinus fangiana]|uniref:Uncharacterized protein n=1 Tax=Carpinus fangiana TaxID=176857 RepID=A0A5N6RCK6_9ROSI|nr:hypothetical protein FH972_014476 [Carpinus fangiana]